MSDTYTTDGDFDFVPDEVEDPSTVTLPAGIYDAVIEDVEKREGKKGAYFNWKFRTTDPEHPDVVMYSITSLSEGAVSISKQTMVRMLGGPLPSPFLLSRDRDLFLGRPVRLKVKIGEWNGEQRSEVERILSADPAALVTAAARPAAAEPPTKKPAKMF